MSEVPLWGTQPRRCMHGFFVLIQVSRSHTRWVSSSLAQTIFVMCWSHLVTRGCESRGLVRDAVGCTASVVHAWRVCINKSLSLARSERYRPHVSREA